MELLVAASVMIIAVVGGFSSHVAGRKLMQEGRDTSLATSILRSNMESLLLRSKAELLDPANNFVPGQPIVSLQGQQLEAQQVLFDTPGFAPGDPVPQVLNVALTLSWNASSGRQRTLTLTSAIR